jgi:glyoxylase-like metal-dependent hydrolase (beta-lactamase superfamily II)
MSAITLGEVTIDSVVEIDRSSFPTPSMLPDSTAEGVARHLSWLKPHFFDERTGDIGSRIQTFIVRTPEHLVLIDTCVGNDKPREEVVVWHRRQGAWLDDLAAAGVTPERVDLVICTHLHIDHVGWNTRLVDGRWTPTFPNAAYLFAGEEWEYWRHERDACIADSVVPVVEAGRARLVEADHVVDPWLSLEPTPGHTPGHVCVRLTTSAGQAVFSGDLMHRVVQVAEPQWSSRFCYDGKRAAETRREFVERHADTGTVILAAHFPRPGPIVRADGSHRFVPA